jgi:uncharacterized membrane protein YqjE
VDSGGQRRPARPPGLFGSLRGLLGTLLALAHTRLELLGTEVREEFVRLGFVLVWGLAALFFAGLSVTLVSVALVAAFWETHRMLVITLLAAGFLVVSALALRAMLSLLREKPRLFEASLGELERDRSRLSDR